MAKPCSLSSFAIQSPIKTIIFKLMTLHETLVYDSDNGPLLFALSSGVFSLRVWPSFIGAVLSLIKVHME